jgi:hypothetical protein
VSARLIQATGQLGSCAGAGMGYVRGLVLTEDGRLLVSFTRAAMIRAFGAAATAPEAAGSRP